MPFYSFNNYDGTYTDVVVFDSSSFRHSLSVALLLPIALAAVFTEAVSEFVSEAAEETVLIYLLISAISGFIMYFGRQRYKVCGIIATVLSLLPFGLSQIFWLMPELAYNCNFDTWLGWLFFTAIIGVYTVFILALLMLFRNGKRHLITVLSLYAAAGIIWLLFII